MSTPLSFENTKHILELLRDEERLVLIGGQAVNYWCDRYRLDAPDLAQHGPFASKDVDFQGDRLIAKECARRLGGTYIPSKERQGAIGIVKYTNADGIEHDVDFFFQAYGLLAHQVLDASVPVNVDLGDRVVTFRVMHPLHCLQSRAHNVMGLSEKYDTPHGLRQLKASIVCLREFIKETAHHSADNAVALNRRVFQFASDDLIAEQLFAKHRIDAFEAVAIDPPIPESFRSEEYPQMKAELEKSRIKQPAPLPQE